VSARHAAALVLLAVSVGGCAWWPFARDGAGLLERADRLTREGAWEDAAAAYDAYLKRYPYGADARRAAAGRDMLRALVAARAELGRLREELTRLRDDLARRDGDLVRVRQEADRLRTDLERLKEIDLKLERRPATPTAPTPPLPSVSPAK
jgi:hypothetical protein